MRTTINKKVGAAVLLVAMLTMPMMVFGAGLIPCGNDINGDGIVKNVVVGGIVTVKEECGFSDILVLANTVIHFLMYQVAVPLAALGFVYTGARLILFQNKEGEWTEAKGRFGDIAMGFGIMLGAFVLIKVVLAAFLGCNQIEFMRFMLDLGSCTV